MADTLVDAHAHLHGRLDLAPSSSILRDLEVHREQLEAAAAVNALTVASLGKSELKAYVAPTMGMGQGVFAARLLRAKEAVMEYIGVPLTQADIDHINHDHFVQVDDDAYIGPSGLVDDYVNHSCEPNTALIHTPQGQHLLIALRDIEAGEELSFDYSMHMTDEAPIGPCVCGTSKCRGMIDVYQSLPAELQDHYERTGLAPGFAIRARQADLARRKRDEAYS